MTIEIDQSGRVEYTSHNTVVADSLGNSILLSTEDKRLLQAIYRIAGRPRMYTLEVFSALVAFIIQKSFKTYHYYIIDMEYKGNKKRPRWLYECLSDD